MLVVWRQGGCTAADLDTMLGAGTDDGAGPAAVSEALEGDLNPQWVASTSAGGCGYTSLFRPRKWAMEVIPGLRDAVLRCAARRPPPEDAVAEANAFIDHFSS